MMRRHCDGTDPNLVHEVTHAAYDPDTMTLSPWDQMARPGEHVINCQCAATFDDAQQSTHWPHQLLAPREN